MSSELVGNRDVQVMRAEKQKKFTSEIAIHFPGLKGLEKPIVWVFPELLICLDCGRAEFTVPETELRVLAKDDADTAAGS
jgi:hypothetical protein